MGSYASSIIGIVVLAVASTAAAVEVNTCGELGRGEVGVLQQAISCETPFLLGESATLDLNGFTLSGWVSCTRARCSVVSTNGAGTIIGGIGARQLVLTNLTVDCDGATIGVFAARSIDATDVTVQSCSDFGIHYSDYSHPRLRVRANGLTVVNNDVGMELNRGSLDGTDITVSGNVKGGIHSGKVKADGITANGNGGVGIGAARKVVVSNASVSGNGLAGIFVTFGKPRVESSVIDANTIDVASAKSPKLIDATCTTSRKIVDRVITSDSWLACAGE